MTSKCELGGQAPYDPQAARPTGREVMKLRKRDLRQQVAYLEDSLDSDRNFSSRLLEGVGAVLDFLDRHLPEQFRPLVERARELLPVPELQQPEQVAGTGPHLGQHGALIGKNSIDNIYSLSGDLKAPSGQAIITTENREKTH